MFRSLFTLGLVTHRLTDSYLVHLTDANSTLLDVVSFADVDAKERVDHSFLEILRLKFG